ncbi:MAG: hypothetical protein JKX79_01540, partial [Labilibaculum sp.]|nr:hypothetical protein [Labilibaculum sp.]
SKPLSIPMGPLSPINDLAGVLIQQYSNDLEETLEMIFQQELAEAKLGGLEKVRSFINGWAHSKDYVYRLEAISTETAGKLLQGEFTTMDSLLNYDSNTESFNKNITILYRIIKNKNRNTPCEIIETLYINK